MEALLVLAILAALFVLAAVTQDEIDSDKTDYEVKQAIFTNGWSVRPL